MMTLKLREFILCSSGRGKAVPFMKRPGNGGFFSRGTGEHNLN